jgi:transposase InsO family protein
VLSEHGCQIAPGTYYAAAKRPPCARVVREEELVIRCQGPWRNRDAVEIATLEWVDWYINRRLFAALGDIPPSEAESAYYATMTPSESPRMAEQTLH